MKNICLVDTSICTDNLGDETIMDAVNAIVWDMFPGAFITRVPSHEALSGRTRRLIYNADLCFVGGTNLISSALHPVGLWRVTPEDANIFASTHTVLLGVGWNDYQTSATPATRKFLQRALSPSFSHSVRDHYTAQHLKQCGIKTLSTSCMTTWSLTPEHCASIPTEKSDTALITLTKWRAAPEADGEFIQAVKRHYRKVLFFPQQKADLSYLHSLGFGEIEVAATTNEGYTAFLEKEVVDVIGSRLHGGIRALQKGRRALILAVDNRAAEIARDTNLPVRDRADIPAIEGWIDAGDRTVVQLPERAINEWKAQFSPENLENTRARERGRPPEPDFRKLPFGGHTLRRFKRALLSGDKQADE
jgi:polysaccharide pyruvyl transferase WcaK-like protein